MELVLKREVFTPDFTLGVITLNGKHLCYTVEDCDRKLESYPVEKMCQKKVYGLTAIPRGKYRVILSKSPRFKKILPLVLEVPCFSGIRIHSGNTAEDSHGCIIVGEKRTSSGVFNSKKVLDSIIQLIESSNEPVYLIVI